MATATVQLSPRVIVPTTCGPAQPAGLGAGGCHEEEHVPAGHLQGRGGAVGGEPVVGVEPAGAHGGPGAAQGVPVLAPPPSTAFRETWLGCGGWSRQRPAADHGLASGLVVATETGLKEARSEVTALGQRQAGLGRVAAPLVGHEGLLEGGGVVLLNRAHRSLGLQLRWRLVGGTPGVGGEAQGGRLLTPGAAHQGVGAVPGR